MQRLAMHNLEAGVGPRQQRCVVCRAFVAAHARLHALSAAYQCTSGHGHTAKHTLLVRHSIADKYVCVHIGARWIVQRDNGAVPNSATIGVADYLDSGHPSARRNAAERRHNTN